MIDFVQGRLVLKSVTRAVIECGGVGYEVLVPVTTSAAMPPPDTVVRLHAVLHVRDDAATIRRWSG
jgi:Holliday junction DNA helicase RuvA